MPNEYAGTGYLSSSFSPFSLGSDPADGGFQVQDLNLPGGIDESRFATRRHILDAVNDHFAKKEKSDGLAAMDTFYQRAYSLISSQKAREAFNIDAEPAAIRDEYGRNAAGQRMLMARRLVAAGVRFVSLQYGGWDLHAGIAAAMKAQMPAFDQAFAALIRDLERTGLLDRTLVMVSSEFGRTPKINKDAGRDHWPKVFSVVLAGGGIKKGLHPRRLERHGQRARARPDRPRGPGHDGLPPARHRRRQGTDGPRRPADRDRRRRQGPHRTAGLIQTQCVPIRVGHAPPRQSSDEDPVVRASEFAVMPSLVAGSLEPARNPADVRTDPPRLGCRSRPCNRPASSFARTLPAGSMMRPNPSIPRDPAPRPRRGSRRPRQA